MELNTNIAPKVSVIVPAYNSGAFILKCLSSLANQTLKNIEIIVVDDGSTDNTVQIVEELMQDDKRIKLIKQKHLRQGAARNNGMKHSSGEYIGFVDSDDWVDVDYYESLYNAAKEYNSDIALATNIRVGNGKTKKRLQITEKKFVTELQDKIDIGNQFKNPCPTNKIYRKTLFEKNNITWPEGVYCEDKLFTIQAVYYANGIVAVPDEYYYYYRNLKSTVNTKNRKKFKQLINDKNNANRSVLEFLKNKNVQIRDKECWAVINEIRFFGVTIYRKKESFHTIRTYLLGLCIKEQQI